MRLGLYRHYKGWRYMVMGVGTHTETGEEMAFYAHYDPPHTFWVRPVAMFSDLVEVNGERVKRFEFIGKTGPAPGEGEVMGKIQNPCRLYKNISCPLGTIIDMANGKPYRKGRRVCALSCPYTETELEKIATGPAPEEGE